ncbi:hypothetical protein DL764_002161 [Monosporascus ibericus]|uniref:Cupin type-2 domain-containing protein n=1 Tax=Monosporascus ibericus TaxID=155417 RepID=A0A4Q4TLM5_9PEZI|nr:hypothetical protein DL764_002161 [Monosporascus ibericus]
MLSAGGWDHSESPDHGHLMSDSSGMKKTICADSRRGIHRRVKLRLGLPSHPAFIYDTVAQFSVHQANRTASSQPKTTRRGDLPHRPAGRDRLLGRQEQLGREWSFRAGLLHGLAAGPPSRAIWTEDFKKADENRQQMGLVRHSGTVMRYVDISPHSSSPMHCTVSQDYGIVISGELECLLDSGKKRVLRPGDVAIQRGTMHQWFNRTDSWARMIFILIHAAKVEAGGEKLGEALGGMQVPASH